LFSQSPLVDITGWDSEAAGKHLITMGYNLWSSLFITRLTQVDDDNGSLILLEWVVKLAS